MSASQLEGWVFDWRPLSESPAALLGHHRNRPDKKPLFRLQPAANWRWMNPSHCMRSIKNKKTFYFCIGNTIGILTDNLLHMLFLVFAFRYLMQFQNEYSVMLRLYSRCGKVMILNVFKTGINTVWLCCVLGVFNSAVATPAHGLIGLSPSFRLQFIL